MAHLVCFIASRWAGNALNPSRKIHAFHSAIIQYRNLLKTNRIIAWENINFQKNKSFFVFIEVSFLTKFGVSNWSAAPCYVEAQNTNSTGKTENSRRMNGQNRVNDFFLKLVSLMTIPAGLNFNLVDELNTNYAKFIRTFPPKLHYAVRIRNIRRNGLWSVPPILYFGKNGNVKRLFVKFVWSIITQY